ncbi:hypothetical protein [Bacteroides sp.]
MQAAALWNVGTNGYYWAASTYGFGSNVYKGAFLNFNGGNINPFNNGYRADAFPVRCVQELTDVCYQCNYLLVDL